MKASASAEACNPCGWWAAPSYTWVADRPTAVGNCLECLAGLWWNWMIHFLLQPPDLATRDWNYCTGLLLGYRSFNSLTATALSIRNGYQLRWRSWQYIRTWSRCVVAAVKPVQIKVSTTNYANLSGIRRSASLML